MKLGICSEQTDNLNAGCTAQEYGEAEEYLVELCGDARHVISPPSDSFSSMTTSAGEITTVVESSAATTGTSTSDSDAGWVEEETMTMTVSLLPTPASSNAAESALTVSEGFEATATEVGEESGAQESDLASASNSRANATSTQTPSVAPTAAPTHLSRLSLSAKIALAAGIPCGALFLVGVVAGVRLVSKRKKITAANEVTGNIAKAEACGRKGCGRELDGADTPRHEMETDGNRIELHVSVERHELDASDFTCGGLKPHSENTSGPVELP